MSSYFAKVLNKNTNLWFYACMELEFWHLDRKLIFHLNVRKMAQRKTITLYYKDP